MLHKNNAFGMRIIVLLGSALFVAWWLYIYLVVRDPDHNSAMNQAFAALYGLIALLGGVIGLAASKRWGGYKSLVGRALLFFGLGLLAQEFGQIAYSFYLYALKVQIPYPSVGDVGYFGSVLCYIYAAIELARATGAKFSLKDKSKKVIAILLPSLLLIGSYVFFLRGYQFNFSSFTAALTVFLDFGYPLGQSIYIAVALVTFLLSKGLLGGVMKSRILLLLFALLVQYIADFSFLNAARAQTVYPAGLNDFTYLIAYTIMAFGLTTFVNPIFNLSSSKGAEAGSE